MPPLPVAPVSEILRRLGRELVLPRFRSLDDTEVAEKGPGDLVTVVDHEVEAALERELPRMVRGSRVVGEELVSKDPSALDDLASGWVWVVDPIDGTANFVEGRDTFGIMVGLLRDGDVLAGWIHSPVQNRTTSAVAGEGALLDGRPWTVSPPDPDEATRNMASTRFLPAPWIREWRARDLSERLVPGFGASAIDYPELVAGHWASLFFWRTYPWDHVAGTLIAREAGAHVARLDGSPYSPVDGRDGLLVALDASEWMRVRKMLPG